MRLSTFRKRTGHRLVALEYAHAMHAEKNLYATNIPKKSEEKRMKIILTNNADYYKDDDDTGTFGFARVS
jgi:CRISPR/Cas system-associated protein Cas7 (RAMP superfamily)